MEENEPAWRTHLEAGRFEAARDGWQRFFEGRTDDLIASWTQAEIEERDGDATLARDPKAAQARYHRAYTVLGASMTRIWQVHHGDTAAGNLEAQRRQEQFNRCFAKAQAISGSGTVSGLAGLQPHPASAPFPERIEPPAPPAPRPPPAPVASAPAPAPEVPVTEPPSVLETPPPAAAAADAPKTSQNPPWLQPLERTTLAREAVGDDHWQQYLLADRWNKIGGALAAAHPAAAAGAYAWAALHWGAYNDQWTAHLPASRWDTDGGAEIQGAVQDRAAALARPDGAPAPAFVDRALAGDLRGALRALEQHAVAPAPPFLAVWELLRDVGRNAADAGIRRAVERCEQAFEPPPGPPP